jgi:hypothetical protein
MARLVWDETAKRFFESGVDRGVLYLSDNTGVAWNGLLSVEETFTGEETTPLYKDGDKYLDLYGFGDFNAKIVAFTYPDEFMDYDGYGSLNGALFVDNQNPKMFGLSYRTLLGSETSPLGNDYQIHLLYNLTVRSEPRNFQNGSNLPSPVNFAWSVSGLPVRIEKYRATSHVILDSRYLQEDVLAKIELLLYGHDRMEEEIIDGGSPSKVDSFFIDGGTSEEPDANFGILDGNDVNWIEATVAELPSITTLIGLIVNWSPFGILPDLSTGIATLTPGGSDLAPSHIYGLYSALPTSRLVETTVNGVYRLS